MKNYLKTKKKYMLFFVDLMIIILSHFFVVAIMVTRNFVSYIPLIINSALMACVCFSIFFVAFRVYNILWYYTTVMDFVSFVAAAALSYLTTVSITSMKLFPNVGIRFTTVIFVFILFSILVSRLTVRIFSGERRKLLLKKNAKNLLIIGAGAACGMLIRDIYRHSDGNYRIIGLIDDDVSKEGCFISGHQVLGARGDILEICKQKEVDEIIIAIPSISENDKNNITSICKKAGVVVKELPSMVAMMQDSDIYNNIKTVSENDLINRDIVDLDNEEIYAHIENKVILVTGAGGSIGSELCKQIAKYDPAMLILLDIYENSVFDLEHEIKASFPSLKLEPTIASIRDFDRIERLFKKYKPNIVFHAAAHKHVPLMETCPGEAIKNNVFGTYNVVRAADRNGVSKFVLISTDKAVNPTNVMGATKCICEMIVHSFNLVSETQFASVRFGNVLNSNGSVVPFFRKQIKRGGPVTVTHKNVTRFFMTIPEAASLVLQAAGYANNGDMFILDMGDPIRIYDLAENLIRLSGYELGVNMHIKVIGLRPGEKMHEELSTENENLTKTKHKKIFIGSPDFHDMETIESYLNILSDALATDDNDTIKAALEKIVPGYAERDKNADNN